MSHTKFRVLVFFAAIAALSVIPVSNVQATIVSLNMGVIFTGDGVPTNPAPWLKATFDDGGSSGSVVLTITAVGLTGGEKVNEVLFNLDPALNPALLAFSAPTKTGSFEDPDISKGVDSFKADGDGYYDILIAFNTDGMMDAFNGGESVKYTITLASLTANSFDFVSAPGGGTGQYITAAQLQALGTSGNSAWVTTPEPATLSLLAVGAAALLRRRKS
ncbi:MAG: PEP-CTERM sorting domain-containing protein [Sedimentisphaerales bacterium]|jgi:hypothetical protein